MQLSSQIILMVLHDISWMISITHNFFFTALHTNIALTGELNLILKKILMDVDQKYLKLKRSKKRNYPIEDSNADTKCMVMIASTNNNSNNTENINQ